MASFWELLLNYLAIMNNFWATITGCSICGLYFLWLGTWFQIFLLNIFYNYFSPKILNLILHAMVFFNFCTCH